MIRVLIAESYPVVRLGLQQILDEVDGIYVIDVATSPAETLHKIQATNCHLLLLSMDMPNNAFELLTSLKRLQPHLQVLLLSLHTNIEMGIRGLRAGATGYINSQSPPDELIKAVRLVAHGRNYVCHEMVESLIIIDSLSLDKPPHKLLSNREFEVLQLFGAGKSVTDIALTLGLGKSTVATYRRRILDKLNLQSTVEIMRYAIEHQTVS